MHGSLLLKGNPTDFASGLGADWAGSNDGGRNDGRESKEI